MQLHIKVESRLERKEGEAARERELAHAREKLVRWYLFFVDQVYDVARLYTCTEEYRVLTPARIIYHVPFIQGSGGSGGETKREIDRSEWGGELGAQWARRCHWVPISGDDGGDGADGDSEGENGGEISQSLITRQAQGCPFSIPSLRIHQLFHCGWETNKNTTTLINTEMFETIDEINLIQGPTDPLSKSHHETMTWHNVTWKDVTQPKCWSNLFNF